MRVSVFYASRHGATRGIAERLGAALREEALVVDVRDVADGPPPVADGYVIGSAVYLGSWLKPAVAFVRRHEQLLTSRPVWLFSSGPLGTGATDPGRNALEAPAIVSELMATIGQRGHRMFYGAYDPTQSPAGISERLVRLRPAARLLQPGDFRDWQAIDTWASEIAVELELLTPAARWASDARAAQREE